MAIPPLTDTDRLLVFAPHPDDESLACGGLIQRALRAGARVSVLVATDGDANPWPQRLVERRWRLDPDASTRWGRRRRQEALDALGILGVPPEEVTFLHWGDQDVTGRLLREGNASADQLRDVLRVVQPTVIAMPSLSDAHPDHSALAILAQAAIRRAGLRPRTLAYWLHGRPSALRGPLPLVLSAAELQVKRTAILAHASQLHFGRKRMLRHAGAIEEFFGADAMPPVAGATWEWEFGGARVPGSRRRLLQIVGVTRTGDLHTASIRLDEQASSGPALHCERAGGRLRIRVSEPWRDVECVVAKLEHQRSPFVYDRGGWSVPHATPKTGRRFPAVELPGSALEMPAPGTAAIGLPAQVAASLSTSDGVAAEVEA